MTKELVADDVCRFILTSIPSIPHLEALLLLRGDRELPWDTEAVAGRLYVSNKTAHQLLDDLKGAGFIVTVTKDSSLYRYAPATTVEALIDRVADTYSRNLVEVTSLIHRRTPTRVQEFADAFRIRKG